MSVFHETYMNPTSGGIPATAFPKNKMREVDKAGSFVHCLLFTPNFRKFGIKSTLWALPALSTPGLNPYHYVYKYPHLVWCGKEKKRKGQCLQEPWDKISWQEFSPHSHERHTKDGRVLRAVIGCQVWSWYRITAIKGWIYIVIKERILKEKNKMY